MTSAPFSHSCRRSLTERNHVSRTFAGLLALCFPLLTPAGAGIAAEPAAAARTEVPAEHAGAAGAQAPIFAPRATLTLPALEQEVAAGDSRITRGALDAELAEVDRRRSRLYENPTFDAGSSVAVGPLNPSSLSRFGDTPQTNVGLSYRFLLGKRGPRRERADAAAMAARASFTSLMREETFGLARVLGRMALQTLRSEALGRFLREEEETLKLTEARLASGFATPLDLDRLQLELARLDQQRIANSAQLQSALADCTTFVGRPCIGFPSAEEARVFVRRWSTSPVPDLKALAARPDLQALDAMAHAAEAAARGADALRVPDPTVRLGYIRDQATSAGNQPNTLALSLSLPLTLLDHGQADSAEAGARAREAREERARLLRAAEARAAALHTALRGHLERQRLLEKAAIPRAESVVQSLTQAASARLISLTDVIQARRSLTDLVMDETDSMGDAFETYLDLLLEISPTEGGPASAGVLGPTGH